MAGMIHSLDIQFEHVQYEEDIPMSFFLNHISHVQ